MEYTTGSGSHETIDGSNAPLPPPPGLKNVGNSCYANAALQCLLRLCLRLRLRLPLREVLLSCLPRRTQMAKRRP